MIAVNDALTKTSFDNRYGTGQSCVFAIADALDEVGIDLRDQPAVVVGYGPVGEGVAAHLRALGVQVGVAETDPVRALRAAHDGYRIGRLHDLARERSSSRPRGRRTRSTPRCCERRRSSRSRAGFHTRSTSTLRRCDRSRARGAHPLRSSSAPAKVRS